MGTDARVSRAVHLTDLGRHDEAERILGELLAEDPQNAYAWAALAWCHLRQDDGDRCRWAAGRALALDPDSGWAHRLRAYGASRSGRHDEAVRHAEEAVRLAPESPAPYVCLANVLVRTRGLRRMKALGEAWAAANKAVALAPDNADGHVCAGHVALCRGRYRDAVRASRRALDLEPDNTSALYNLARAHERQFSLVPFRGLLRAIRDLGGVLALDPSMDDARLYIDGVAFRLVRAVLLVSLWPFLLMLFLGFNQIAGHHAAVILVRRIVAVILIAGWAAVIVLPLRRLPGQILAYLSWFPRRRARNAMLTTATALALILTSLVGWLPGPFQIAAAIGAGALIGPARLIETFRSLIQGQP